MPSLHGTAEGMPSLHGTVEGMPSLHGTVERHAVVTWHGREHATTVSNAPRISLMDAVFMLAKGGGL